MTCCIQIPSPSLCHQAKSVLQVTTYRRREREGMKIIVRSPIFDLSSLKLIRYLTYKHLVLLQLDTMGHTYNIEYLRLTFCYVK